MKCARCQNPIRTAPNLRYCPECKLITKKELTRKSYERSVVVQRELKEGHRATATKYVPSATGTILTDHEQFLHDQALRTKQNIPTITVIYKPGSAEFKRISQELMERTANEPRSAKRASFGTVPSDFRQYATAR